MVARHLCINGFEELQEFQAAMTALELSDDFASGHIQRCEQRRCAVTLVVVRARAGFSKRQWQPRLGAIQSLDLALSSTHSTKARSGGAIYSPTTSRTLSTK